ncbi:MAG: GtrA family protein [Gammaproteobacteria bacterium]|nr:GtrA family protein [Gammaproteobacteria bacterium]MDP2142000.1 GtrA family protein [Gammaproteobacteria bacterium]MDP2348421.1 GtrA family protein [Gammaproteobacteria bacterium]
MKLVFLYSLFAIAAMAANILSQEFALLLYSGGYAIVFAILCGTGVGLVAKYLLDRRYIFQAATRPLSKDLSQFIAYSATGVLTTLLFWGTEISFDLLFDTKLARYTGAVLGLSIGYVIKYQLDRRFVFAARTL